MRGVVTLVERSVRRMEHLMQTTGGLGLEYPPTMWALLEAAASAEPDRVALEDDAGRSLTRSELKSLAERVAAGLVDLSVDSSSIVSWQLPTVIEAVVLLLALVRLGCVQNPMIPLLREREIDFIADEVHCDLLVVPSSWRGFDHGSMARDLMSSRGFAVLELDLESFRTLDEETCLPLGDPRGLPPAPFMAPPAGEARWIYYSSGTTGAPKGGRHTDSSLMASASSLITGIGLGADDVYPIPWPIAHIGGAALLTTSLSAGTRLVLFDSFDRVETPRRIADHKVTYLGTALPFFRAFLDAQALSDEVLFGSVRAATFGGAPLPAAIHDEVRDVLGVDAVLGAWGLTEFPNATAAHEDDPPEIRRRTVGRAGPGVSIRVGAPDGSGVSFDGEGELHLRGPQCFLGYVNTSLNENAFDEEGWFRTGDLGSIDKQGYVRITGRLKDVIIRNAENISALEIEDVVRTHPAVADVAVLGLADPMTGERVCAVVVTRPGCSVTLAELGELCTTAGLSRYKHPEQVEMVDVLPRDTMGKVKKEVLRAELVQA
jgi:acyl-CoA synthetase (AMP-forming)/AMP-acid ligase II